MKYQDILCAYSLPVCLCIYICLLLPYFKRMLCLDARIRHWHQKDKSTERAPGLNFVGGKWIFRRLLIFPFPPVQYSAFHLFNLSGHCGLIDTKADHLCAPSSLVIHSCMSDEMQLWICMIYGMLPDCLSFPTNTNLVRWRGKVMGQCIFYVICHISARMCVFVMPQW